MQTPPRVRGRATGAHRRPLAVIRLLAGPVVVLALGISSSASGAVLVGASQAAARAPQAASARGISPMHELETQALSAINDLRRERGVAALRPNPVLAVAASQHSLSMAEHGLFEHASANGSPFSTRAGAMYPRGAYRFWSVGENMAWASPRLSAQEAIDLWLASPTHRANLLSPVWREIGLGAVHAVVAGGAYDGRAVTILTADFGVRRS